MKNQTPGRWLLYLGIAMTLLSVALLFALNNDIMLGFIVLSICTMSAGLALSESKTRGTCKRTGSTA